MKDEEKDHFDNNDQEEKEEREKELTDSSRTLLSDVGEEIKEAYLSYAMSVIVGRALPDVRDGLKPVHRRVLYSMEKMGNTPDKAYKKSARIVGDIIGKYHPHGDMAVYDTIVRMAQDFSYRYPLVDGQGNFGSIDGDSAAAQRYTEIRMSKIAQELLADIDKETVNLIPNYDNSLQEPEVLPAKIPQLLLNGSSGIAVGMATNIPPHNLAEVVDGAIMIIEDPQVSIEELMKVIKGPDFPTGGIICGRTGIRSAYETGKGIIKVQAAVFTEGVDGGKNGGKKNPRIIIRELPYQVNKANLIEDIAQLVQDKKILDITNLRDESDRKGMRVVIELKRDANVDIVLNNLYKHTKMKITFGINVLAISESRPKTFNLKELLECFLAHRKEVVERRTRYELRKAKERAHILEGLKIALSNIDEVVQIIKKADNVKTAHDKLKSRFGLSDIQAQAILDRLSWI